jgi:hypothetical protein
MGPAALAAQQAGVPLADVGPAAAGPQVGAAEVPAAQQAAAAAPVGAAAGQAAAAPAEARAGPGSHLYTGQVPDQHPGVEDSTTCQLGGSSCSRKNRRSSGRQVNWQLMPQYWQHVMSMM